MDDAAFYLLCGVALFSNVSIALTNIFLVPLTLVFGLRLYKKRDDWRRALPGGWMNISLGVLLAVLLVVSLFSPEMLRSMWIVLDDFGYRMLGMYAVLLFVRERRRLAVIALCALISYTVNNIVLIGQGVFLGNLRAAGFSFYMIVGSMLSMVTPVLLILLLSVRIAPPYHSVVMGAFAVSLPAIYYNGTRGAWIAIAVTLLVTCGILIRRKKKFYIAVFCSGITVLGLCMVSPYLSERIASIGDMKMQSNTERICLWTSAFHMFEDHPLTGVGRGRFRSEYRDHYILPEAKEGALPHAHNNLIQMLAECGLFGALALIFFWGSFVVHGLRLWLRRRNPMGLVLLAVMMGFVLHGMTEYNMGHTNVVKFFGLLLGLCLAWIRADDEKECCV